MATLACTLGQTLEELKQHFSQELKMPATLIMLMFDGANMDDKLTLADLGVGPNGTVQLELQSADPVNTPIRAFRPRQEYHMPDVITVRVPTGEGGASQANYQSISGKWAYSRCKIGKKVVVRNFSKTLIFMKYYYIRETAYQKIAHRK